MKQKTHLLFGLFALICLSVPIPVNAQQGTGNVEVRFEATDAATFPTITSRVTVLDPAGMPIPGLDASSFKVFEDGQWVPVVRVEPYINPDVQIAVALVIDISGSMYEEIGEARSAAATFVNGLGANDRVAVIAFRGDKGEVNLDEPFPQINPEREIDFTSDKAQVLALIDRLEVPSSQAGRTPLYDALSKAVRMTSRVSGVDYRFVMAFTDGNEKCKDCGGSVLKADDPIREAEKHNIPVFTIGLGQDADEDYLKRVAWTTGGTYQFTPTPDRLAAIYQGVVDRLKQQYLVTYTARAAADGKEHKLDVKVATPVGEGSNILPIQYPCPQKPGIRLFYLKPPEVVGEEETVEPLENGQEVKAIFTVVPDISACHPIARVQLYLDGTLAFETTNKPFHLIYDYYALQRQAPGSHQLTVRAYDDAGNVSDDVTVTVTVPSIAGTLQSGTSVPTVLTPVGPGTPLPTLVVTPMPESSVQIGTLKVPYWALALAGLGLLLLVAAILFLTQRKPRRRCPTCGRVMDPSWSECLFCAGQRSATVAETTVPEQPVPVLEDRTVPEISLPPFAPAPLQPIAPVAPQPTGPVVPPPAPPPAARTEILRRQPQRLGWLIVEQGERVGKEFRLLEGDTSIGRAGTNDIVLSDPAVSRQQAKVRLEADGYVLYDLAATNPTLVNGQEVARHQLKEGDRVQIGNTVLVFKEMHTG